MSRSVISPMSIHAAIAAAIILSAISSGCLDPSIPPSQEPVESKPIYSFCGEMQNSSAETYCLGKFVGPSFVDGLDGVSQNVLEFQFLIDGTPHKLFLDDETYEPVAISNTHANRFLGPTFYGRATAMIFLLPLHWHGILPMEGKIEPFNWLGLEGEIERLNDANVEARFEFRGNSGDLVLLHYLFNLDPETGVALRIENQITSNGTSAFDKPEEIWTAEPNSDLGIFRISAGLNISNFEFQNRPMGPWTGSPPEDGRGARWIGIEDSVSIARRASPEVDSYFTRADSPVLAYAEFQNYQVVPTNRENFTDEYRWILSWQDAIGNFSFTINFNQFMADYAPQLAFVRLNDDGVTYANLHEMVRPNLVLLDHVLDKCSEQSRGEDFELYYREQGVGYGNTTYGGASWWQGPTYECKIQRTSFLMEASTGFVYYFDSGQSR